MQHGTVVEHDSDVFVVHGRRAPQSLLAASRRRTTSSSASAKSRWRTGRSRGKRVEILADDDVVGFGTEEAMALGGAIGAASTMRDAPVRAGNLACGTRGRAGGDAVVDEMRGTTGQIEPRATAAKALGSTFELLALTGFGDAQLARAHSDLREHTLVQDAVHRPRRSRPSRARAETAHRACGRGGRRASLQRLGNLERDRHPPARQTEDDDLLGQPIATAPRACGRRSDGRGTAPSSSSRLLLPANKVPSSAIQGAAEARRRGIVRCPHAPTSSGSCRSPK